jgi:exodeoxyribonuclease V beta subunit
MEFLYPIPEPAQPRLGAAPPPRADDGRAAWRIERGVVKGYIDYLFEHEGRVYVCDWKGDALPDWSAERVAAHCERNYGIQARLYTLAALRLLGVWDEATYEARFGGVLYAFLRGMRPDDADAGVYFQRPAFAEVTAWEEALLDARFWGGAA